MIEQDRQYVMWKELQDFVKQVERESSTKPGSEKPYIDKIKAILTRQNHSVEEQSIATAKE